MNQQNKSENNQSKFIKLLKKNVKRVIAEKGIKAMTRKGDKELDLLVKKVVNQPIQTKEEASQLGERLGEKIAELSQQKGKTNLDKSVIRILATQGELPSFLKVAPQPKAKAASSPVAPKTTEKDIQEPKAKAAPSLIEVEITEEETPEPTLEAEITEDDDDETPEPTLEAEITEDDDDETLEPTLEAEITEDDDDETPESTLETETPEDDEDSTLQEIEESQQEQLLPS